MLRIAKYLLVYSAVVSLLLQPAAVISQPANSASASASASTSAEADARIYLSDGSVVAGKLLEKSDDLIILQVEEKIFTFDPQTEVDRIVTLNSLGADASGPHAAGVAALMLEANPDLHPWQIKSIMQKTCKRLSKRPNYDLGHGLIQALDAVREVRKYRT